MSISPFDDVIAAIATPAGRGAIAVVRASGRGAGEILLRLCPSLGGVLPPRRVQTLAAVHDPADGELLDRGLVAWYPGPGSYTGEDSFEVSTHGGVLAPRLVLDAMLAAGARPALPGEFTRRAYLNGKIDLLQAEAVLDLVEGGSRALHRAAVDQLERGLSKRVEELRAALLAVEASVAYGIDFPEEDSPPVPPERIREAARRALARIEALLDTAREGELLREGALLVLAGEPNSGKSSLFNALLGFERAIVTEHPGTTRDAIEATVELGGFPFRLVDTAGLRETVDPVEGIGIEVARRYLSGADTVLFCIPADRQPNAMEAAFLREVPPDAMILLRTKADVVSGRQPGTSGSELHVSALTGAGLPALRDALVERAFGGTRAQYDSPVITRARHARALRAAADELQAFVAACGEGVPMELASTHLRAAVASLEDLIGAVTPDDVLGHLFAEFCVGK